MWWLPALIACGTPAQSTEPVPEPEPVEAPAPEPEPEPEPQTVKITIGAQCEDPEEGEPADQAAFEARLADAGLEVAKVESMSVCEACGTCPRMAFLVTTAQPDEVKALFAGPTAKVKVAAGRKCQDPVEGAPTTVDELLAALEEAGVAVVSHEEMMVCQSCGCPQVAAMVDVAPDAKAKVDELSAEWTPEPEEGKKKKLKSSFP